MTDRVEEWPEERIQERLRIIEEARHVTQPTNEDY